MIVQPAPKASLPVEIIASRNFTDWLQSQQISLAFTTYQSSRLMMLGVNEKGQISGTERVFDRAMGLYATPERIYLSSKYQLWQLDNVLAPGQLYDGYDKLYVPRLGYTTGDLDIHDLAVENSEQHSSLHKIVFISSVLNCLATVSTSHSCLPLWKPSFISSLVNEDRCHLNGLAMVDGKPRYVTICGQSDVVNGWRELRDNGGCVIDIESDEIITTGLSMPHSPRFYRGKVWLLNSGTGEFGYINTNTEKFQPGKFQPIIFCPGFQRGLAFFGDYAIVGLSKSRYETFSGLKLDENLASNNTDAYCGLMVININTGELAHWVRLEGEVTELYDVQVLPGVRRPQMLGFYSEEIEQIITLDPHSPLIKGVGAEQLYQQALTLQQQGKFREAINQYEQIIAQYPQYLPAWYQLAVIADNQGQTDQAIYGYQYVLTLDPKHYKAYNNLGIIRVAQKDLEKAIACFESAIENSPDYAFAHNNLGLVWQMQGKFPQAAAQFRSALEKNPAYAEAYLNLGIVLEAQDNSEGAVACFRTAIRHKPDYIKAYNRLGTALLSLSQSGKVELEDAIEIFERALVLQPDSVEAFTHLFCIRESICDWDKRQSNLERIKQQIKLEIQTGKATTLSALEALRKPWERNFLLEIARSHAQAIEQEWTQARQSLDFTHPTSQSNRSRGRLRIGYLSSDLCNHPVGNLITGLLRSHSCDNFEIFAYSTGKDDNSEYRRNVVQYSEHFQDIATLSIEESARLIFNDGIHILVDLNGYTAGSRCATLALRPVPIQVSYAGFPGTMGADFIDYIISDAVVTPKEYALDFSEKLVILPSSYHLNDNQQVISSTPVTRSQHGLPSEGFVFCCFNNISKIEPDIFDVWMRIMASVPESVLWLLTRHSAAQENLRREAQARGINGDRLIFAQFEPKAEHLARHRLADLFLDTLYYNAHTSAYDALWAGLPVITCPGTTFASRVAASLLTAVGLPELITTNIKEYEQLAIHLAHSPTQLQQLKQKLAQNATTCPLFDTPRFTRNLEQAYRAMWEIYATGKPPQPINLI